MWWKVENVDKRLVGLVIFLKGTEMGNSKKIGLNISQSLFQARTGMDNVKGFLKSSTRSSSLNIYTS